MKKLPCFAALSAVFLIASGAPLAAQILTTTNLAYTAAPLFASSPDYVVTGLASDPGGRIFYLESDGAFPPSLPSRLWRRNVNGNAVGPAQLLHDFGAPLAGNFLTYAAGTIYGGEFTSGSLFAIDAAGANYDPLGTVPSNYDGVLIGGSLYVSHVLEGSNRITKFELVADPGNGRMLSAEERILETGGESSGPLDFTSGGNLVYGSAVRGLYTYSPAEVNAAATGPMDLTLDPQHLTVPDVNFGYLVSLPRNEIWGTSFTTLQRADIGARTSSEIATSDATIGHLRASGETLYVNVTDFGAQRSVVYTVVPEPGLPAILAAALAFGSGRRPRRGLSSRSSLSSSARCKLLRSACPR